MSNQIYVWDKFVRVFHWSLVTLFCVSYLTGEELELVHVYSGYLICGLVVSRIIWGVVGSRYARFKTFLFSPATIIDYAKSYRQGNPKHFIGHNPLAGVMIVALLATLLAISVSGMKLYAVEEGKGPLAQVPRVQLVNSAYADDDDEHEGYENEDYENHGYENEGEEFWEDIHEASVNMMILLIVLHLLGVAVSSRLHNERLVASMISGFKTKP